MVSVQAGPVLVAPELGGAVVALQIAGADADGLDPDQRLARLALRDRDLLEAVVVRSVTDDGLHLLGDLFGHLTPESPTAILSAVWLRSHYRAACTFVQNDCSAKFCVRTDVQCHTRFGAILVHAQVGSAHAGERTGRRRLRTARPATSRHRCCTPRRGCTTRTTPPRPRSPSNSAPAAPPSAGCWPRRSGGHRPHRGGSTRRGARPATWPTGWPARSTLDVGLPQPRRCPTPGPGRTIVDVMGRALAPAVGTRARRGRAAAGRRAAGVVGAHGLRGRPVRAGAAARRASSPRPSAATTSPRSGTRPTRSPGWSPTGSADGPNYLFAPGTARRRDLYQSLLNDPSIQRVLHLWPHARCALMGIGAPPLIALGHPPIRADRIDVAALRRRRRLLALLRPGRRRGRLRGRRPPDRRGTRSAAPHSGDHRRRRRQGQGRLHHRGRSRRLLQPTGHRPGHRSGDPRKLGRRRCDISEGVQ